MILLFYFTRGCFALQEVLFSWVVPNLRTYIVLIDGLCKNGYLSEALELFYDLEKCKSKLNIEFVSCLIDGLCRVRRLETA